MELRLPLKRKWFEMTKGEKREEYREINLYWFKRLVFDSQKVIDYRNINSDEKVISVCKDAFWSTFFIGFKPFTKNVMTLGYPKSGDKERTLVLEHLGIEIGPGRPEWGSEPDKLYFVIKHGDVIKQ